MCLNFLSSSFVCTDLLINIVNKSLIGVVENYCYFGKLVIRIVRFSETSEELLLKACFSVMLIDMNRYIFRLLEGRISFLWSLGVVFLSQFFFDCRHSACPLRLLPSSFFLLYGLLRQSMFANTSTCKRLYIGHWMPLLNHACCYAIQYSCMCFRSTYASRK